MPRSAATLIALFLTLAACSTPPEPAALDALPPDFALGVTITEPAGSAARDAAASAPPPRAMRPARYIVEPDGVLRAAMGPGAAPTTYPPRTRQLSRRQVDQVWRLVRDSDLLDTDDPARIDSPASFVASRAHPAALLEVSYSGTRRYFRVILDGTSDESLSVERITDRLADLAWVEW